MLTDDLGFSSAPTRGLDAACDRYEAARRGDPTRMLEDFLGDVPPEERGALLRELVLLDIHYLCVAGTIPSAADYLKRFPVLDPAWLAAAIAASAPADAPRRIGRFELRERVGTGGFGTVWKAHDTGLDRDVALKVLKGSDAPSPGDLERFRREARAAGRLRHPGIATVHEACVVDGQPVLVQELIDGVSLRDLLGRRRLSVEEAARLVATVAEALDYAHEMGVVHRDVKPGNVLVSEDDLRPVVVDFGLARREDAPATLSQEGLVLGTPAYMSPEQASGGGGAVDRRTDVYGLGVMLYEIACGQPPFTGTTTAVIGKVVSGAMPRPSSVDPRLPRDLETIILKAAARLPDDRYPTARALADDLRRFLDGEPISARRHSTWYVLRKSIARHRMAVSVAAAFALLLIAASVIVTVLALRARREAATSEQISTFLASLFESSDPEQAQGQDPRASEILARGASRLDEGLASQPLVKARLQQVIGDVYCDIARPAEAEPLLVDSLRARERELGGDHPDVADALSRLATSHAQLNRLDEARAEAQRALDIRAKEFGDQHESVGSSHRQLGEIAILGQDYTLAERHFRKSMAIHSASMGAASIQVAHDLAGLSEVLTESGQFDRALEAAEQALAIANAGLPAGDPEMARFLLALAATRAGVSQWDEALAACDAALEIRRTNLGEEHPLVASSLIRRAEILPYLDRLGEVEPTLRQALALQEKAGGPNGLGAAAACVALGQHLGHVGRGDEALALLRRNLDICTEWHGPGTKPVLIALTLLARQEASNGLMESAEAHFRERVAGDMALVPPEPEFLAYTQWELASLLQARGKRAEALAVAREARSVLLEDAAPRSFAISSVANSLGDLFLGAGSPREARPMYELCLAIRMKTQLREDMWLAQAYNSVGGGLRYTGCPDAAVDAYRRSIEINEREQGSASPDVMRVKLNVANALLQAGRPAEALPIGQEMAAAWRMVGPAGRGDLETAQRIVAEALCATGAADEGALLAEDLGRFGETPEPRTLLANLAALGRCRAAQGRHEDAVRLLGDALDAGSRIGTPPGISWARVLESRSASLSALGRVDEARMAATEAAAIRESVSAPCP